MLRFFMTICLAVLLVTPACAEYQSLGEELVVRAYCSAEMTGFWGGYSKYSVRIFTVPESGGSRLLAAYIENESLPDSPYMLLRGPVATRWGNVRPAPGFSKDRNQSDSCRYWADRTTAKPGGGVATSTVEFDLGARPPVLRSLDSTGREKVEPLVRLAQTETHKMLARSHVVAERQTRAMRFRVLEANMGDGGLRMSEVKVSKLPSSPLLAAIAQNGPEGRREVRVLEASQWWSAVRILSVPAQDDPNGAFVFEAIAVDPHPELGDPEKRRADLVRYEVTLDKVTRTLVSSGWVLNVESDLWEHEGERPENFRSREP